MTVSVFDLFKPGIAGSAPKFVQFKLLDFQRVKPWWSR